MFADYLSWAEKHYGKAVTSYAFRAKKKDTDKDFMIHLGFSDGSECTVSGFKDPFYKLFLSSRWFRESCYECPFAAEERVADITLGDFWNAEKLPNSFGKGRRISVVLINTDRGQQMVDTVRNEVELVESNMETAKAGNANLYRPTRKYSGYQGYAMLGEDVISREAESGLAVKKYVFNQLPHNVKRILKKVIR
jgi:coenzyme F420-reducing hydrogenase beta subunit